MSDTDRIKRLEERVAVLEAMVARLTRETRQPAVGTSINPLFGQPTTGSRPWPGLGPGLERAFQNLDHID